MIFVSLIPFIVFIYNSESNFKKTQIKELRERRRQRLDKEHGIDRAAMNKDFDRLDEIYRVTEKEEIKQLQQIGQTAKQYYDRKDQIMKKQEHPDDGNDQNEIRKQLLKKDEDVEVNLLQGENFEQIAIQTQNQNYPDKRISGPKIVFDTRLDKIKSVNDSKQVIKSRQD